MEGFFFKTYFASTIFLLSQLASAQTYPQTQATTQNGSVTTVTVSNGSAAGRGPQNQINPLIRHNHVAPNLNKTGCSILSNIYPGAQIRVLQDEQGKNTYCEVVGASTAGISTDITQQQNECSDALGVRNKNQTGAYPECYGNGKDSQYGSLGMAGMSLIAAAAGSDPKALCTMIQAEGGSAAGLTAKLKGKCMSEINDCKNKCSIPVKVFNAVKLQTAYNTYSKSGPYGGGLFLSLLQSGNDDSGIIETHNLNDVDATMNDNYQTCQNLEMVNNNSSMQMEQQALNQFLQGQQCASNVNAMAGMFATPPNTAVCSGPDAASYSFCPAYCQANPGQGVCANSACSDPTSAMNNPSCGAIYCAFNPTAQQCVTAGNTAANAPASLGVGGLPGLSGLGGLQGPAVTDTSNGAYSGNPSGSPSQQQYPNGSQSGSDGGLMGANPLGGGAQQANQKGQGGPGFNTGIDHGVNGGGGYSTSSVPLAEGGGNGYPRFGAGGDSNGAAKLGEYLPGGKLDPNRAPASDTSLVAQGITGKNDLSNFEKVHRAMLKWQPFSRPGNSK